MNISFSFVYTRILFIFSVCKLRNKNVYNIRLIKTRIEII